MAKTIAINYKTSLDDTVLSIPLTYEKDENENIQIIRFTVDLPYGQIPVWLKPHKFEVRALYNGNSYEPLMNETSGVHTLDAALFIYKAQEEVFLVEKRPAFAAKAKVKR